MDSMLRWLDVNENSADIAALLADFIVQAFRWDSGFKRKSVQLQLDRVNRSYLISKF